MIYYPLGRGDEQSEGEYQAQYEMCQSVGFEDRVSPPPKGYWRVRGGALLEIRKMSIEHLENAISLFTRTGHGDHPKILELKKELENR